MKATLAVAGAGILVLAGVALAGGTGRSPEAAAADTTAPATATSTLPPTTTTAAPTTTTSTTTTTTTTTVLPVEAVIATLAADLSEALEAAAPRHLKPKEAREIGKDVAEAVGAYLGGDLEKAAKKLSDAAERVDKDVDSAGVRSGLLGLLAEIAAAMGVDLAA
jgi:hypothetical protein